MQSYARLIKKQRSISKLAGKKIVASYRIKWSNGEKRQEEEAEVVAATQKRKMLRKTRRANLVITYAGLSLFLNPFSCICSQRPNFQGW